MDWKLGWKAGHTHNNTILLTAIPQEILTDHWKSMATNNVVIYIQPRQHRRAHYDFHHIPSSLMGGATPPPHSQPLFTH